MPRWLRALVSWFSHAIFRGRSEPAALQLATETFPDFDRARLEEGLRLGRVAVETAARANLLQPGDPLRVALGGHPAPEDEVEVRAVVEIERPDGSTIFRTIKLPMHWSDSWGMYLDALEGSIRDWLMRYPGSRVAGVTVTPPMLAGR